MPARIRAIGTPGGRTALAQRATCGDRDVDNPPAEISLGRQEEDHRPDDERIAADSAQQRVDDLDAPECAPNTLEATAVVCVAVRASVSPPISSSMRWLCAGGRLARRPPRGQ